MIGFCKFVDFFKDKHYYYLITECGGTELLNFIQLNHPFNVNNNKSGQIDNNNNAYENESENESKNNENTKENRIIVDKWKKYIQYHFRIIVRCVYYLHKHCNIAHLDLSLCN